MSGAFLSVQNVAKRFNGVSAVADLSFEVVAGSITGLIGPNGSGKTSTMNMITGLYRADAGAIRLDGVDILGLPPFRIANLGVARTFQNIRLLADRTVFDNVALGCHASRPSGLLPAWFRPRAGGGGGPDVEDRCREALDRLGVGHLGWRRAGGLSYGDRRRVEIARSFAMQPRLLLLDEPAAGMSHAERRKLSEIIQGIRDSGITVLLIEHDMELVARTCDTIVVLNFGREIAVGAPGEIRGNAAVIEAYLGREDA